MWSTRTAALRLAIVILAFMTAWKTLVTHTSLPHRAAVDTTTRITHSILDVSAEAAHGEPETIRNLPGAVLTIPHHLEDLRVFRKSVSDSSSPIDHLPIGPEQLKEHPDFARAVSDSGLHAPHPPWKVTADPPYSEPPGQLRARLQAWLV